MMILKVEGREEIFVALNTKKSNRASLLDFNVDYHISVDSFKYKINKGG